jgi:hypothetical protein
MDVIWASWEETVFNDSIENLNMVFFLHLGGPGVSGTSV